MIASLDPFFDVIQRGLADLVDGELYFDMIADDAVFEFRYDFPGWPRRTESRDALMAPNRSRPFRNIISAPDDSVPTAVLVDLPHPNRVIT